MFTFSFTLPVWWYVIEKLLIHLYWELKERLSELFSTVLCMGVHCDHNQNHMSSSYQWTRASWCSFKRRLIGLCCAYTAFLCEVSILGIIFVCVYVYVGCYENGCQYQCSWLPEKTPHLWNSAIIASCHLFRDSLAIFLYTTEEINYEQSFSTKFFTPQAVSITSSPIKDITTK